MVGWDATRRSSSKAGPKPCLLVLCSRNLVETSAPVTRREVTWRAFEPAAPFRNTSTSMRSSLCDVARQSRDQTRTRTAGAERRRAPWPWLLSGKVRNSRCRPIPAARQGQLPGSTELAYTAKAQVGGKLAQVGSVWSTASPAGCRTILQGVPGPDRAGQHPRARWLSRSPRAISGRTCQSREAASSLRGCVGCSAAQPGRTCRLPTFPGWWLHSPEAPRYRERQQLLERVVKMLPERGW